MDCRLLKLALDFPVQDILVCYVSRSPANPVDGGLVISLY